MTQAPDRLLPAGVTIWVLASGKIGHEVHCMALARALGVEPTIKPVQPRLLFQALSPWGPIDPRDAPSRPGSPFAPPFPDLAIAAGRTTIPYLRALKRASANRLFTICMQDPRIGGRAADMIWVPEHDKLRGDNVFVTLTSPHGLESAALAAARETPDPRIKALCGPRIAMLLGGASAHHTFEAKDIAALAGIARDLVAAGNSVMVTPSRRTPPAMLQAIRTALAGADAFVWDGAGDNPYAQIMAHADAIIVTADSANMMGEALATGVPVHVYEPAGGHAKLNSFLTRLIDLRLVRRWTGALESWVSSPVDATRDIAIEAARRYRAFKP